MSRSLACCSLLLAAFAACGGKVVVDSTSATGAVGGANTGGWGSGGTTESGAGGCDAAAHTISPVGYDTSCNVDADCVNVFFGDLCGNCLCPFASINVGGEAEYQAESAAKSVAHTGIVCSCPASHAVCLGGTCEGMVP
jgi:hypothetical protein